MISVHATRLVRRLEMKCWIKSVGNNPHTMKTKLIASLTIALGLCTSAYAQYAPDSTNFVALRKSSPPQNIFVETTNFVVNLPIPDNNISGIASSMDVNSSFTRIGDLNVTLKISGGFNGDLYGYITHESGFSILLNRPGKTADNPFGYSDSGFDVKFDDDATLGDVHLYRLKLSGNNNTAVSPLTGTWAPDARTADPGAVRDTDPRLSLLNSFIGIDPRGKWTLFLADLSPGGASTLVSWGLEVTNIPEPTPIALMIAGGFALLFVSQRFRKS
jgi:subtilisin-like proprotein convertase family protein